MNDNTIKLLAGLKRHEAHLIDYGRRLTQTYPPDQIQPHIFENITVPVSLPIALMLYGLAASLCVEATVPPVTPTAPEPPA